MSEQKLLTCPICGKELTVYGPEDWKQTFYDPDSGGDPYNTVCDCGFSFSNGSYEYKDFMDAVNRRHSEPNEPLALEQLREMDGCPVWTVTIGLEGSGRWELCACETICACPWKQVIRCVTAIGEVTDYEIDTYSKTWIAYRHKPEETQ
jgi:hypothetical protein